MSWAHFRGRQSVLALADGSDALTPWAAQLHGSLSQALPWQLRCVRGTYKDPFRLERHWVSYPNLQRFSVFCVVFECCRKRLPGFPMASYCRELLRVFPIDVRVGFQFLVLCCKSGNLFKGCFSLISLLTSPEKNKKTRTFILTDHFLSVTWTKKQGLFLTCVRNADALRSYMVAWGWQDWSSSPV